MTASTWGATTSGIIVGLDSDGPDTEQRLKDFIDVSNIPMLTINLLQALPRTPLWDRLAAEGRLNEDQSRESNVEFLLPYGDVVAAWRRCIAAAYQPDSVAPNNPTAPGISWVGASPYSNGAAFSGSPPTPTWATTEFGDVGFSTYVSTTAPPALNRDGTQTTVTSPSNPAAPGPVTFTASVRQR